MIHKMMRLQWFGAAIFFLGVLISCEKDDITGSDVQPGDKVLSGAVVDSFDITTGFIAEPAAFATQEAFLNILGAYNDSIFGLAKFSIAFEVEPPEDVIALLPNAMIDSVVLTMRTLDIYGSEQSLPIEAFYLADSLGSDEFYTNDTLIGTSAGISNVHFSEEQTVFGEDTLAYASVKLDPTLWEDLLSEDTLEYADYAEFSDFLGGIMLAPITDGIAVDQGAVGRYELWADESIVTMYLSDGDTTQAVVFPIGADVQRVNMTDFDRSNSAISTYTNDGIADEPLVVQGMAGIYGLVNINGLRDSLSNAQYVNNAELVLNIDTSTTDLFDAPGKMKLQYLDQSSVLQDVYGLSEEVLDGTYTESTGQYIYKFGPFLQDWLADTAFASEDDLQLVILVSNEHWHPHRAVLHNTISGNPGIEFEVIYTPK